MIVIKKIKVIGEDREDEELTAIAEVYDDGSLFVSVEDRVGESPCVHMSPDEAREWAVEIIKAIDAATGGGP